MQFRAEKCGFPDQVGKRRCSFVLGSAVFLTGLVRGDAISEWGSVVFLTTLVRGDAVLK
ncbi:hypothetical protein BIFGAL_03523 [Bifidobacterium gallicum DSM 20093 = LMG 11596]|uniref:Uncharacterized protein n=1 Tax=Bifidobacterium gallicum DSM 20093 = LMG 11596 TaxID=561180 RepID=D1NUJ8_9BIFI|nr:hypothetical protein BIFGAL_03523 [Bifidobacterium gallicum DSM 20093 = LMG 11596]